MEYVLGIIIGISTAIIVITLFVVYVAPTKWYVREVTYSDGDVEYALMAGHRLWNSVIATSADCADLMHSAACLNMPDRRPVRSRIVRDN